MDHNPRNLGKASHTVEEEVRAEGMPHLCTRTWLERLFLPVPSLRFILYPGLLQHKCEMLCAEETSSLEMVFFVANSISLS